jgi:hypothetical protein
MNSSTHTFLFVSCRSTGLHKNPVPLDEALIAFGAAVDAHNFRE